jgi:hypothetical protein
MRLDVTFQMRSPVLEWASDVYRNFEPPIHICGTLHAAKGTEGKLLTPAKYTIHSQTKRCYSRGGVVRGACFFTGYDGSHQEHRRLTLKVMVLIVVIHKPRRHAQSTNPAATHAEAVAASSGRALQAVGALLDTTICSLGPIIS